MQLLWAEPEKQNSWWEGQEEGDERQASGEDAVIGTWGYLRRHRDRFLTRQFVKQSLAFAQGQIKQAEAKPEVNGKKVTFIFSIPVYIFFHIHHVECAGIQRHQVAE